MHETCSIYFCVERDVKCVWRKPHSEMGARMCVCEGATLKFAVCLRQVVNHSVQSPPKTPGLLPRTGLTGSHLQLEVPRTQEAADPLPCRWDVPALGWRSQLVIGWTTWELTASFVFLTRWTEQGWRCGGGERDIGESSLQPRHPLPHGGLAGQEEPEWEPKSFSTIPTSPRANQVQPFGSGFSSSLRSQSRLRVG